MFEGFEQQVLEVNGTTINLVKGGSGPPVLMLHGYPQTHAMWNKIAPRLAEDFTVVCPDLRGYGDSGKVEGDPEHLNYSKRTMAQDQVDVMKRLGFDKFFLVGHDRGGRVSHRLTKDHPDSVLKLNPGHHPHPQDVPDSGQGICHQHLSLVLFDPALRFPGKSDWGRP